MIDQRPLLYDIFCGAGGATKGYQRAGFRVVGIDHKPQPRYCGDDFMQMGAFDFFRLYEDGKLPEAQAFHASPPCQGYGQTQYVISCSKKKYPKLIADIYARLKATTALWILENVVGAPMLNPITICGTSLGLRVRRHRLFDSNLLLFSPGACRHGSNDLGVYANKVTRIGTRGKAYIAGSGRTHYRPQTAKKADGQLAMGIDWMTLPEMCEAIPPADAEFIGRQVYPHCLKLAA